MANSSRGLGVGLFQRAEEAVGDGGEDMHMLGDGEEDQEGQQYPGMQPPPEDQPGDDPAAAAAAAAAAAEEAGCEGGDGHPAGQLFCSEGYFRAMIAEVGDHRGWR